MNTRDAARRDAGVPSQITEAKPKMGRKEKAPKGSMMEAIQNLFIEVLTKAAAKVPANLTKSGVQIDASRGMVILSGKGFSRSDFEAKWTVYLDLADGPGAYSTVNLWTGYEDAMSKGDNEVRQNLDIYANLMNDVSAYVADFFKDR